MKKFLSRMNRTLFDISVGPSILFTFGVPLFLILVVIGISIAAVILITKTRRK